MILGSYGCGKTNLCRIVSGEKFKIDSDATIVCSFVEQKIRVNNKDYLYNLWDTAGAEKYIALNKRFINNANIILIIFILNIKKFF